MFTRCAHCETWFRVGPDAVRAAHGQVRCGFCGEQFNALSTLCDNLPADAFPGRLPADEHAEAVAAGAFPAEDLPPAEATDFHIDLVEDEQEWLTAAAFDEPHEQLDEIDLPDRVDMAPATPSAAPSPEAQPEPENARDDIIPEDIAIGTPPPAPADSAPLQAEPALPERWDETQDDDVEAGADIVASGAPPPREMPSAAPMRRRRHFPVWLAWTLGSIALLAAALTQLAIYHRDDLRRNPATAAAVENLYAAFGHPLPPRRDLAALVVTGAQVTSEPEAPGALVVTAVLTNKADFDQPFPLLQVGLTNRSGGTVGRGLFPAQDYLPARRKSGVEIGAGSSVPVHLRIADPGEEAVGFVITPCFGTAAGADCSPGPEAAR